VEWLARLAGALFTRAERAKVFNCLGNSVSVQTKHDTLRDSRQRANAGFNKSEGSPQRAIIGPSTTHPFLFSVNRDIEEHFLRDLGVLQGCQSKHHRVHV
jgi:hypothetical protein